MIGRRTRVCIINTRAHFLQRIQSQSRPKECSWIWASCCWCTNRSTLLYAIFIVRGVVGVKVSLFSSGSFFLWEKSHYSHHPLAGSSYVRRRRRARNLGRRVSEKPRRDVAEETSNVRIFVETVVLASLAKFANLNCCILCMWMDGWMDGMMHWNLSSPACLHMGLADHVYITYSMLWFRTWCTSLTCIWGLFSNVIS